MLFTCPAPPPPRFHDVRPPFAAVSCTPSPRAPPSSTVSSPSCPSSGSAAARPHVPSGWHTKTPTGSPSSPTGAAQMPAAVLSAAPVVPPPRARGFGHDGGSRRLPVRTCPMCQTRLSGRCPGCSYRTSRRHLGWRRFRNPDLRRSTCHRYRRLRPHAPAAVSTRLRRGRWGCRRMTETRQAGPARRVPGRRRRRMRNRGNEQWLEEGVV